MLSLVPDLLHLMLCVWDSPTLFHYFVSWFSLTCIIYNISWWKYSKYIFHYFLTYWDLGRPQSEALWIELHISIISVAGTIVVGVAMIEMYSSGRYCLMVIFPRRLHQSALPSAVYGRSWCSSSIIDLMLASFLFNPYYDGTCRWAPERSFMSWGWTPHKWDLYFKKRPQIFLDFFTPCKHTKKILWLKRRLSLGFPRACILNLDFLRQNYEGKLMFCVRHQDSLCPGSHKAQDDAPTAFPLHSLVILMERC